jgi:hypothetical protein
MYQILGKGNGLVAKWLSMLCGRGNVRPKGEGLICVDVKLLFVFSKAWFVQFVQWNPVIMSLARFWVFQLQI